MTFIFDAFHSKMISEFFHPTFEFGGFSNPGNIVRQVREPRSESGGAGDLPKNTPIAIKAPLDAKVSIDELSSLANLVTGSLWRFWNLGFPSGFSLVSSLFCEFVMTVFVNG